VKGWYRWRPRRLLRTRVRLHATLIGGSIGAINLRLAPALSLGLATFSVVRAGGDASGTEEEPRGHAAVITRISWESPRSRAAGVTIVFGPMKIFCCLVMATRMSFSLTNSMILISGADGFAIGGLSASDLAVSPEDDSADLEGGDGGDAVRATEPATCSATAAAATSAGVA